MSINYSDNGLGKYFEKLWLLTLITTNIIKLIINIQNTEITESSWYLNCILSELLFMGDIFNKFN